METKWKVDHAHSELFFKITHLMISEITGFIKSFSLDVGTEGADFGQVKEVIFTADLASLSTNNEKRDVHLKSADFFDITNYPMLSFTGARFEKQGLNPPNFLSANRKDYKLYGNLTIKGITRTVILDGEFGGTVIDAADQKKAGFTLRGKISRKDFGLDWEDHTGASKVVLGDEVRITGNIQLIKQT